MRVQVQPIALRIFYEKPSGKPPRTIGASGRVTRPV